MGVVGVRLRIIVFNSIEIFKTHRLNVDAERLELGRLSDPVQDSKDILQTMLELLLASGRWFAWAGHYNAQSWNGRGYKNGQAGATDWPSNCADDPFTSSYPLFFLKSQMVFCCFVLLHMLEKRREMTFQDISFPVVRTIDDRLLRERGFDMCGWILMCWHSSSKHMLVNFRMRWPWTQSWIAHWGQVRRESKRPCALVNFLSYIICLMILAYF